MSKQELIDLVEDLRHCGCCATPCPNCGRIYEIAPGERGHCDCGAVIESVMQEYQRNAA